jgi:hypothetical protein
MERIQDALLYGKATTQAVRKMRIDNAQELFSSGGRRHEEKANTWFGQMWKDSKRKPLKILHTARV